jgi:3-oxoacyl-[acyl-carrier protein] reductase
MSGPLDAFDQTGKVALVTGAASGIGRATAVMLAAVGATVVCADIDAGGANATASAIGGAATGRRLDVTDASDVDAAVAEAVDTHGKLDVMANVAGIIVMGKVVDLTDEDLDRVFAVNLRGVYHGCRAAARVMTAQGSGSIVNMASGAIDTPSPTLAGYAMTKAAVAQLTKILALEVAKSGVRVNAIAPGFVVTAMTGRHYTRADGTIDEAARDATLARMSKTTPLGDVGRPDDVAYAVLYLCSDAARFVTGQILRPNGGVAMPW